ncbi:MAG TPA: hypothetical protein VIA62_08635 [Thermoanaerobaculia bacterium]|jgi:hypothetical protein|nr:hypothetical protein [Thermoanaerobaculia bacterium]
MKRIFLSYVLCGLTVGAGLAAAQEWPQWGQNSQHTGTSAAAGQSTRHILDSVVYDPFVSIETNADNGAGDLLVHYQVPLIDGDNAYMMFKAGTYTNITTWETQTWGEKKYEWDNGHLTQEWSFTSDWKPIPYSFDADGPAWEPVFQPAMTDGVLFIPGASGSVYKVSKQTGNVLSHFQPFGSDSSTYTIGPLTVDRFGNLIYQVVKFDLSGGDPYAVDVVNAWLVKVWSNGVVQKATWASLTPNAPHGTDQCQGTFDTSQLPFPPSPNAVAPTVQCGSQRPLSGLAPAVGTDGTIYVGSVAHFTERASYLVAVNSNLTPKWATSLKERFNDGCNVLVPPNGTPGGCRTGAHTGVDPATNRPPSARLYDDSTASPIVAPDGSIFYGVYTRYNFAQGHLMHFSANGQVLGSYLFGWDTTPSIWSHNGTYSVIMKENHYSNVGSYCNDNTICPPDRSATTPNDPEIYFLTQLSPSLHREWQWQNTNQLSCTRQPNGQVTCVNDHPNGFEFCVNAAVVDRNGVTYVNSEDGNVYVVRQGGTLKDHLFLNLAIGAAYTPLSMTSDGKVFTQNDGVMFVVGN